MKKAFLLYMIIISFYLLSYFDSAIYLSNNNVHLISFYTVNSLMNNNLLSTLLFFHFTLLIFCIMRKKHRDIILLFIFYCLSTVFMLADNNVIEYANFSMFCIVYLLISKHSKIYLDLIVTLLLLIWSGIGFGYLFLPLLYLCNKKYKYGLIILFVFFINSIQSLDYLRNFFYFANNLIVGSFDKIINFNLNVQESLILILFIGFFHYLHSNANENILQKNEYIFLLLMYIVGISEFWVTLVVVFVILDKSIYTVENNEIGKVLNYKVVLCFVILGMIFSKNYNFNASDQIIGKNFYPYYNVNQILITERVK